MYHPPIIRPSLNRQDIYDKFRRQISSCEQDNFSEHFVAVTEFRDRILWFDFVRPIAATKSEKISLSLFAQCGNIFATCRGKFQAGLKYRSVTDIVQPIREIVRRTEETTGHSVRPK
jgi:hypothetical protein